jgi:hypothetical protein
MQPQYNPQFVRVTPLVAWSLVILAYCMTGMLFLAGEPIISGIYSALYNSLPDQAIGSANTLKLLFYAVPILFDLLLSLWAFLVTTRRYPVTTRGPVF